METLMTVVGVLIVSYVVYVLLMVIEDRRPPDTPQDTDLGGN